MATVKTELAAKELAEKFAAIDNIKVVEQKSVRRIGRAVASEEGYQIIDDNGSVMVTVKITEYAVLAVRSCERCGAEVLTAAIGEHGYDLCPACKAQTEAEAEQHHSERQAEMQEQAWREETHNALNS